jgi:hypothetical protein
MRETGIALGRRPLLGVARAYPRLEEFVAAKRRHNPELLFPPRVMGKLHRPAVGC